MPSRETLFLLIGLCMGSCPSIWCAGPGEPGSPYARQIADQEARLKSPHAVTRAGAAEALGFLRAYQAEPALIDGLRDEEVEVRRQSPLALAWCGGRGAVGPLLEALEDADPVTRQAACVSLMNLTGMEFPLDTLAPNPQRVRQMQRWRDWWSTVPEDRPPQEVLELLKDWKDPFSGRSVTVSSTYKGPPAALVDGRIGPEFWQTKNVPFPQWCTVDLGRSETISQVAIHQSG